VHAFQTAERIRQVHPDKDWFQLTGLVHDIGKVMSVWGEPQVKEAATQVTHIKFNLTLFFFAMVTVIIVYMLIDYEYCQMYPHN